MNPTHGLAWLPALILVLSGCADEPDELELTAFRGLEDGLELHWSFEDSVGTQITDLSGNGRHGTLNGGALVASPLGQAVSLDGIDDYIAFNGPRSPALYGGADGSFTFSARVRVSNVAKDNTLCFGCGPFSTMYVGTAAYGPLVMAALLNQSTQGKLWPKSSPALIANEWTQVTLVVENGSSARYYLDCAAAGQLDDANLGLQDPGYSSVGMSGNANRWFGGEIDELRIWSRALTEQELAQLCPAADPLAQNLEMHWTFEDRVGNEIADLSGNGRNGTAVGGSFVSSPLGEALSLDGIDDKVSFVGPRALALYGGSQGDFTLSARVRVSDPNKYNTLCFGCGPFSTMYVGNPDPGAGKGWANLWNSNTQANLWTTSAAGFVGSNEWQELTLVVDGGVSARWYRDCTLDTTMNNANIGLRDPGYSSIGESANASRWYQGEIDQLRIWSRALPESELALLCPADPCATPIHVDVDAPANGDGQSWATAFNTVQAALDAASASECPMPQLWLAEGVYAPNSAQPVATIAAPVEIYGGFSGSETSLAQRDIVAHPVTLGAANWQAKIVDILGSATVEYQSVRLDGLRLTGSSKGALRIIPDYGNMTNGTLYLANMTFADNTNNGGGAPEGAAVEARGIERLEISNSTFERNEAARGGAIYTINTAVEISNSIFIDNSANQGGAIYSYNLIEDYAIADTDFSDNTASYGGAIYIGIRPNVPNTATMSITGGEFVGNEAAQGGAMYLLEGSYTLDSLVFDNNTAFHAGGVQFANAESGIAFGPIEIANCRFIGNSATNGNGGGLRLQEPGATVINTEFVGNSASQSGGGMWGRATVIASTFANNTAGIAGSGLHAPAGADMFVRHSVAYPDVISGQNIYAPYSCTKNNVLGSPRTTLASTPFAPADLDGDQRTEYYLIPDGPCQGLEGGVLDEIDWSSLTVDASQCTDAGWPEPGVHYAPQSAAGACE